MSEFRATFHEVESTMHATFLDDTSLLNAAFQDGPTLYERYDGPYTITPTSNAQTLSVRNHVMVEDLVIEPIPSNYGLITWNGSVLTVS